VTLILGEIIQRLPIFGYGNGIHLKLNEIQEVLSNGNSKE
jgi:hypothetical protein